ncbi:efflux RND transporter periplasmic adaptor subunit [Flexibacterium corallicola]|uniref:efflux RND transporter periplasmic adaptor subunit n=1 Tax=Flexibacterium corallicola TaxID=3037259 RepID=UPI00286F8560|nr:efflux RND transporter periplasmic adaptor subunit [Pseudovibrio sp. M1P-2-3]
MKKLSTISGRNLFAGLLVTFSLAACQQEQDAPKQDIRPVYWMEVERIGASSVRHLSGSAQASTHAPLSFEVAGTVEDVLVQVGTVVTKGEPLARINTRNLELELEARESEMAEAQATLAEADADFKRKAKLFSDGWIAKSALDSVKARKDSTASRVSSLSSRVDRVREDLKDAVLYAPYDGVIDERLIEPSQQITAGQTVFNIQGNDGVEVIVAVPETLIKGLKLGSQHPIVLPNYSDEDYEGVVSEIATQTREGNAFRVVLQLKNWPEGLRMGATAEVSLNVANKFTATEAETSFSSIPLTAFIPVPQKDGLAHAFKIDPQTNAVEQVEIKVAEFTSETAVVSGNLTAGDLIVTKGVAYLHDGQQVKRIGVGPRVYNP